VTKCFNLDRRWTLSQYTGLNLKMTRKAIGFPHNFILKEEKFDRLVEGHGMKNETILEVYLYKVQLTAMVINVLL
jgi:hypothetical protein